ncbi:MAG: hypothetical protein JWM10_5329 [Myxococcaceae bacterium]|nr:hypothetical protein [Myxococcaceae bacterium]
MVLLGMVEDVGVEALRDVLEIASPPAVVVLVLADNGTHDINITATVTVVGVGDRTTGSCAR